MSGARRLIAGLGNPGPQYAATRHNVGFGVVDLLADRLGATLARHRRAHALAAETRIGEPGALTPVTLCEPLSFMNASGGPIKALGAFYGSGPDDLIVVHDELDVPFGSIRVKFGGGDNGHNGLRSIRSALGTGDFTRVRVGVGRPPGRQDPADWVLRPFASAQRTQLPEIIDRAADAVESLVTDGLPATQNRFNS